MLPDEPDPAPSRGRSQPAKRDTLIGRYTNVTHRTLIISDTHLGKAGSVTADELRPVWEGVDELVINGDSAEVQVPWLRGAAVRELDRLDQLTAVDGVRLTLISGNHDAYLTDRRCLQRANGHILVMHGDALHPAVVPWTQAAKTLCERTLSEIKKAQQDDLTTRLDIAQHVGHSEFLRDYVLTNPGESTVRRILARPIEVPMVLWYWRREPALAARFLEQYAPQARVIVVGHSHRRGVWRRGPYTIINTGAFMFPGRPQCVLHDGDTLSVHHIAKQGKTYRREEKARITLQGDWLVQREDPERTAKPHAA